MKLNKHIYYLEQLTNKKVILVEKDEKETFFVPQDLEGRQEKYIQSIYRLLQQETIEGDLVLENLPIKDLGKVKRVNGNVIINNCCNLEHLGYLEFVRGNFFCSLNNLTTLKGSPKLVGRDFYCNDNKLITLKGAPKKVGKSFYCGKNQLITLEGCPKEVKYDFYCSNNRLTTLKGAPEEVGRDFICLNNIKQFTKEEVRAVCNVKESIHVNLNEYK